MANNFKNEEQRRHWYDYNNEYSRKNYRAYCMKFNRVNDKDVIDFIDSSPDSAAITIKKLIREKIRSGK